MKKNENNKKIIIIVAVVIALVIIGVVAFMQFRQPQQENGVQVPALTGITVSPATVVVGATHTFRATAVPAGAAIGAVTFAVENTAIGTINPATGVFTALTAGDTTITATSGNVVGRATVTVRVPTPEFPLE